MGPAEIQQQDGPLLRSGDFTSSRSREEVTAERDDQINPQRTLNVPDKSTQDAKCRVAVDEVLDRPCDDVEMDSDAEEAI